MAPTVRQVHLSGFHTSEAWTLCGMKREALLLKEDRVVSTARATATDRRWVRKAARLLRRVTCAGCRAELTRLSLSGGAGT